MDIIKFSKSLPTDVMSKTLKVLGRGGLVIFPSDTVYGALVDATNEEGVRKLTAFKNRPPGKPISVFVSDWNMLKEQVEVSKKQEDLLNEMLPGPFTVILPSKHQASKLLESEKGTLGVRYPNYQPVTNLVKQYGKPFTATSANLSGRSPHYSIETLLKEFPNEKKKLIDLVVDAGILPRNKPSTLIDLTGSQMKLLRQGDILFENTKTFISESPTQTKKIAQFIFEKVKKMLKEKPVIFILKGDLGTGKTIFVKGIGEWLGVEDITSPTYVIYYEYKVKDDFVKNLYHFDLYQIEEEEEFKHLGIEKLLQQGNLLCMEWGEKSGDIFEMLKKQAKIIEVNIEYDKIDQKKRKIFLSY